MVSDLGECIPCFPDNRGRFGATGSDLGNGMRKFVNEKRILISPEPVRHLNMCVLSQNTTYIQYIFKYKTRHTYNIYSNTYITYIHTYIHYIHINTYIHIYIHTYIYIYIYIHTHTHTHTHTYITLRYINYTIDHGSLCYITSCYITLHYSFQLIRELLRCTLTQGNSAVLIL